MQIPATNPVAIQINAMLTTISEQNGWGKNTALSTWKGIVLTSDHREVLDEITTTFEIGLQQKTNWGKNELRDLFLVSALTAVLDSAV